MLYIIHKKFPLSIWMGNISNGELDWISALPIIKLTEKKSLSVQNCSMKMNKAVKMPHVFAMYPFLSLSCSGHIFIRSETPFWNAEEVFLSLRYLLEPPFSEESFANLINDVAKILLFTTRQKGKELKERKHSWKQWHKYVVKKNYSAYELTCRWVVKLFANIWTVNVGRIFKSFYNRNSDWCLPNRAFFL